MGVSSPLYVAIIPYASLDFERLDETVPPLSAHIDEPGVSIGGAKMNENSGGIHAGFSPTELWSSAE